FCYLRPSSPYLVTALLSLLTIAAMPASGSSYQRPGHTEWISWNPGDAQPDAGSYSSVSADGRYVAFYTSASNLVPDDTNGVFDVFVRDTKTGVVDLVSVASDGTHGNDSSVWPSISADGRYVA